MTWSDFFVFVSIRSIAVWRMNWKRAKVGARRPVRNLLQCSTQETVMLWIRAMGRVKMKRRQIYFGDRTDRTSSYTVNRHLIPEFVLEKSQIIVYLTRQTDFTLTSCKVNRLNLECELNGLIKFTYWRVTFWFPFSLSSSFKTPTAKEVYRYET